LSPREFLDTPPDVIPFSARLLYYAQCAWGVEGGHQASKIDQQTRLKLLQAMFADCAGMIRQSTESFADEQITLIQDQVANIFPELVEATQAEFTDIIQSNQPQLPKQFFDLSSNTIEVNTTKKTEKVGVMKVEETYTKRRFFFFKVKDTRFIEKDICKEFEYREVQVPDFAEMSDQWGQGIERAESELWHIIATWIKNYLQKISDEFKDATNGVIELMQNSIQIRLAKNDQELEVFKQSWLQVESQKERLVQHRKKLQQQINE